LDFAKSADFLYLEGMKFSALLILISFNTAALAQVQQKDYPSNRLRCNFFELEALKSADSLPLPFSRVELMDVRSDTSKYGFLRLLGRSAQFKYCFKDGATAQLTRFMNGYLVNNLDPDKTSYVLICLRRLWITRDDTSIADLVTKDRLRTMLKAEFYLCINNTFHPLFRIDTTLSREGHRGIRAAGMVEEALSAALDRLKNVDYIRAQNRSIQKEEIEKYYAGMYSIPVLNTRPAKGVYRTFEEFKQNRPSDTAFEIKFEPLADHLYVKDKNGNQYLERNVWGICDGENVFIKVQANFYQLFRQQNTWEFYGVKWKQMMLARPGGDFSSYGAISPGTALLAMALTEVLANTKVNTGKMFAYQVDIETGKVF
jgi:hypothetical protein